MQEGQDGGPASPSRAGRPVSLSTRRPTDSGWRGPTFILGVLSIFRAPYTHPFLLIYLSLPVFVLLIRQ